MMIQFSSSSQPHFSTEHGTWSNWTFSYSNAYRSHHYLFAHTVPTFWSTSSLSLYLVNFPVFFKVPTQISFLQEDSPTSKAGFRSPPLVLPLLCTFLIRAFITLCCQWLWLAYCLGWTVSALRAGHTSVIHILVCMYTSPVWTFANFTILTSGPFTTLASQFFCTLLQWSVPHPTPATDSPTHCSPSYHQELQPLHDLKCIHPTLQPPHTFQLTPFSIGTSTILLS